MSTDDKPIQPTQREVMVGGRLVQYWEYRSELPNVIIFLHGFRGNHRGLMQVARRLTGYRLILPDLPGYGESETLTDPHDFKHYSTWLEQFLKQLNIKHCILAGHSYGATLALVAASEQPSYLQSLVLVEPVLDAQTFTSRLGQAYYWIGSHLPKRPQQPWIANPLLNRLSTELMSTTKQRELKQRIVRDEQDNLQYIIPQVEIESYLGFYRIDVDALAARISVPTLIIAGQRDTMTPVHSMKKLARTIPSATLQLLSKAGHFVPMEDPEILAETMNRGLGNLDEQT